MKFIPLRNGGQAIVDDADYAWLSAYTWRHSHRGRYVTTTRKVNGALLVMHRVITNAPKGMHVDHVNRNPFDNRRENLRLCTHQQNQFNRGPQQGRKYKGVSRPDASGKYEVHFGFGGGRYYLGIYDSEEEAARVYDSAAAYHFGEFAYLNFPNPTPRSVEEICNKIRGRRGSGVVYIARKQRYICRIEFHGRRVQCGAFKTEDEAIARVAEVRAYLKEHRQLPPDLHEQYALRLHEDQGYARLRQSVHHTVEAIYRDLGKANAKARAKRAVLRLLHDRAAYLVAKPEFIASPPPDPVVPEYTPPASEPPTAIAQVPDLTVYRPSEYRNRPNKDCVYYLCHQGDVVYVGVTCNLLRRLREHQVKAYDGVFFVPMTADHAGPKQIDEIHRLSPAYNKRR